MVKLKRYRYAISIILVIGLGMIQPKIMKWSIPLFMVLFIMMAFLAQHHLDQRKDEFYYNNLDIIKYIFSLLIIILHLRPFFQNHQFLDIIFNNMLSRVCVPIYFMITGYFVAVKEKEEMQYIKQYIRKMISLYLLWSLLYLPLFYQCGQTVFDQLIARLAFENFLILKIMFLPGMLFVGLIYSGTYYHLWYFPAVIMALWIVDKWKKRWSIYGLFFISFILLIVGASETYYGVLPTDFQVWANYYFRLFFTTRNFLFFGLFYITLGYIIAQRKALNLKMCVLKLILSILLLACETAFLYNSHRLDSNILLSCVPLCYYMFICLICFKNSACIQFPFALLSKYYYLVHPMVIVFVQAVFTGIEQIPFVNVLCVIMLTHCVSLLIMKLKLVYQQIKALDCFGNLTN